MNKKENDFLVFLLEGKFTQAKAISLDALSLEDFYTFIIDIASHVVPDSDTKSNLIADVGPLTLYAFICFILTKNESARIHSLAYSIMIQFPLRYNGVLSAALLHMRRAANLDPNNVRYKKYLLSFYDTHQQLLDEHEAERIARDILQIDSQKNNIKNAQNDFMTALLKGYYEYARSMLFDQDISNNIIKLAFETESIALYTFVCFSIIESESSDKHRLTSNLLLAPLCFIGGSYSTNLFHARRLVELEPNNVIHKKYLLSFYDDPAKLLHAQEAELIVRDLLKTDPNNKELLEKLREIESNIMVHYGKLHYWKNLKIKFMKEIAIGDYTSAKAFSIDILPFEDFCTFIIDLAYSNKSIKLHAFVCFLLKEKESARMHMLASSLLLLTLDCIKALEGSSLSHAQRAVELEPDNLSYKVYLLLFYDIPNQSLNATEAKRLAHDIVRTDPNHPTAVDVLSRIEDHQ